MVNLKKIFLPVLYLKKGVYQLFFIGFFSCFYSLLATGSLEIIVPEDASAEMGNTLFNPTIPSKAGPGTLTWSNGQSTTELTTVKEGILQQDAGELKGSLSVKQGATFRSRAATVPNVSNEGNVEMSKNGDTSPHHLAVTNFTQVSRANSTLSVRIFPSGGSDPKDFCDYVDVDTLATLTGKLKIYVEKPEEFDTEDDVYYPIIRGKIPHSITGDFISFVNAKGEDVYLGHAIDEDEQNFFVVARGGVLYEPPTATSYQNGLPLNVDLNTSKGERIDILKIGSTGGFSNFEMPGSWCRKLTINFAQTNTGAEENTELTNSYDGIGEVPHLPNTVDELWLTGDPWGYDILVQGGRQYALPTPAPGTRIRFSFSKSPYKNPLGWFQGDLPASCQVIIEPGSADPFINSVLPFGGSLIVGAPITLDEGVAGSIAASTLAPFTIQRYTNADIEQSSITLTEPTTFSAGVFGIKLKGPFSATFKADSNLFNISEDTGAAGINAEEASIIKLYHAPGYSMPMVKSLCVDGSNVIETNDNINSAYAPTISPQLGSN